MSNTKLNNKEMAVTVFIAFFLGMAIGAFAGKSAAGATWKEDAIRNNAGEYNKTTGEFQWIKAENKELTNEG